jgi:hypothetical protein
MGTRAAGHLPAPALPGPRQGSPDRVIAAKNELENESVIARGLSKKFGGLR